jgi:hypothetical protein
MIPLAPNNVYFTDMGIEHVCFDILRPGVPDLDRHPMSHNPNIKLELRKIQQWQWYRFQGDQELATCLPPLLQSPPLAQRTLRPRLPLIDSGVPVMPCERNHQISI